MLSCAWKWNRCCRRSRRPEANSCAGPPRTCCSRRAMEPPTASWIGQPHRALSDRCRNRPRRHGRSLPRGSHRRAIRSAGGHQAGARGHGVGVHRGALPRERQILATLNHPNIARLLDGGTTDDGVPYLVMELIDGERIDAYCQAQRLSVTERLRHFSRGVRAPSSMRISAW